jgi:hypothetical protein
LIRLPCCSTKSTEIQRNLRARAAFKDESKVKKTEEAKNNLIRLPCCSTKSTEIRRNKRSRAAFKDETKVKKTAEAKNNLIRPPCCCTKSSEIQRNKRARAAFKDESKVKNTEKAKTLHKKRLRSSHDKPCQVVDSIGETPGAGLTPCIDESTSENVSISMTANIDACMLIQEPLAETMMNFTIQDHLEVGDYSSEKILAFRPQETVGLSQVNYMQEEAKTEDLLKNTIAKLFSYLG